MADPIYNNRIRYDKCSHLEDLYENTTLYNRTFNLISYENDKPMIQNIWGSAGNNVSSLITQNQKYRKHPDLIDLESDLQGKTIRHTKCNQMEQTNKCMINRNQPIEFEENNPIDSMKGAPNHIEPINICDLKHMEPSEVQFYHPLDIN